MQFNQLVKNIMSISNIRQLQYFTEPVFGASQKNLCSTKFFIHLGSLNGIHVTEILSTPQQVSTASD